MTDPRTRPFDEPDVQAAAALVSEIMGAGTVRRLDTVHGALCAEFRRGRDACEQEAASRADVGVPL